ncbi:MAG: hypothetical protein LC808_18410, partial [Actinobacteria bacterium]|nr:hypothetical protein [Actinomycetota bacterium]
QEDLGLQIAYMAARSQVEPKELAEQLVSQGRLGPVAADVMRRKALDLVVEQMNVVGRPLRPEPIRAEETSVDGTLNEEEAEKEGVEGNTA